jgi:hypothetical protein
VNAIITFTFIGATINPTYKDNCWGIDGQCISHQNRVGQGFFRQGLLVKYGGMIEVWVECKLKWLALQVARTFITNCEDALNALNL